MTGEKYVALNGKSMADADQLLEAGGSPQASEKYWGAAAEILKAIAESRHSRYSSHRDLRNAVSRLHRETGDGELLTLFSEAESLHATCEDFMEPEDVRYYAGRIKQIDGQAETNPELAGTRGHDIWLR